MPTAQELVNGGYIGYQGWDDESANADFNATGGSGKEGGGGSGSGGSNTVSDFSFDQAAAEKAAKEQLLPYYKRLLEIYDGNVALAKKRMEADYERGLRYKKEETINAQGDITANKAESDRRFKIAMGDLTQEMNSRGLTNSGIKATEEQNAEAGELFNQNQYDAKSRDLALAEKKYIEGEDVNKKRFLEEEGFADSGVSGYINNRRQYQDEIGHDFEGDVATKIANAENRAITYHNTSATPLTTLTPTNYSELLDNALTTSGLPPTS